MSALLADTDLFIDLMRADADHHEAAVARVHELQADGVAIHMAAVTRFELFTGTERFHDPPEARRRVQRTIDRYPALAMTPAIADRAGKVHGRLVVEGTPIGVVDAMVAATALEHDVSVLTRNVDEYERVQGLMVETY